jgi:hypothetical protein
MRHENLVSKVVATSLSQGKTVQSASVADVRNRSMPAAPFSWARFTHHRLFGSADYFDRTNVFKTNPDRLPDFCFLSQYGGVPKRTGVPTSKNSESGA